MDELLAVIDVLQAKVNTLVDQNTQYRAQLASAVDPAAVEAARGKAQAILDTVNTVVA